MVLRMQYSGYPKKFQHEVHFIFCIGYKRTLLEDLSKDILGIVEFHEVGRTLLEGLHEESLSVVEFYEVGKNLLE